MLGAKNIQDVCKRVVTIFQERLCPCELDANLRIHISLHNPLFVIV
jgi:hypothetical protein